jgi:hypothetical protein
VLLEPSDGSRIDFSRPLGEPALLSPDSVSWCVFKNPLSLFIGGVAAMLMELSEPRVRTGVSEHTTFRLNPTPRLRRTGLAAMLTIYGARSTAEAMIARVRRMHDVVAGTTPSGEAYRERSRAFELGSGHGSIRLFASLSHLCTTALCVGARPLLCRGRSTRLWRKPSGVRSSSPRRRSLRRIASGLARRLTPIKSGTLSDIIQRQEF